VPDLAQQQNFDAVEIQALQVRDNIFMLVGSGGNITMQVGEDGILLVDTQYAPLSDKIVAAIRKISPKPIHYIVNTHHHGDHSGGNANLRAAGTTVSGATWPGHPRLRRRRGDRRPRTCWPVENDDREQAPTPWPTSTFFGAKRLYYNGRYEVIRCGTPRRRRHRVLPAIRCDLRR
jgi:glyoxylase-like metal-dependent hydrolase (beta-lactamase superfamily II)